MNVIVFSMFFLASSLRLSKMCRFASSRSILIIRCRVVVVWHLVVVVSVIRVSYLRMWRCSLSSRLKVVTRRPYPPCTPCISPYPCLFSHIFLHLSNFPAFPPRDTLHGVKSHSLHLSIDPKSGTLGGPSPGHPTVLSNSNALNSVSPC